MFARYYSAGLSRFLSADPKTFSELEEDEEESFLANPQNWNLYTYVLNNPLRYSDPDGEDAYDVANAIDRTVGDALASLDANTGGDALSVAANAIAGTVGDIASGMSDLLRVGAETGETIGEGKGGSYLASAVSKDVGRAAGLFAALASPAASIGGGPSSATRVAMQGGKHSGFLQNLTKQGPNQVGKTVRSLSKQISAHRGKLAEARKAGNKGLAKKYKTEIKTFKEQRTIARDVQRMRR
jgi:RHS repeat-associated protein